MTRLNYLINISFCTVVKNKQNCLIYFAFIFGVAHICELHATSHVLFKQIRWLLLSQIASLPPTLHSIRDECLYSIFVLCSLTWRFK
jgi:hypothetical protein